MDGALLRTRQTDDVAQREKVYSAEKNSAGIRLAIVVFNSLAYPTVLSHVGHVVWLAYTLVGVALAYSLFVVVAQPYRRFPAMLHACFTSSLDAVLIALWVYATGGWDSPFFVLWYVSIVAVAFRYSYRWAMVTAGLYSAAYAGLIVLLGQLPGHEGDLLVRIAYIFFAGAAGGVVSTEAFQQARSKLEMRDMNAELERMVADRTTQLQVANQELEALSYSVSHDLRAPLRSVDGFSQVLIEDFSATLAPEARSYLQRIRGASQRMSQLIDDMLQLSRLTRADMRRGSVDLSAMAEEILADLCQHEPSRAITQVIAEGVVADADPQLIRIVLANLLGNAWKFTSKHDNARIKFGASMDEGMPTYYVRDDGAGFDMAYAAKLFGVFQRLHNLAEFEGNGVGLATVQRIVRRHGGKAWAEGAPEQGATFYFTLGESAPRADVAPSATERDQALQLAEAVT
ncbi:MAG TPA: ATP-binding protein [Chloroflexota bacterium]|nr:ATP-binding protein [Chloroflexota bacterium]